MAKAPARRTAPHIAVIGGKPTTTSRDIAETFGKRHDNLLRAIAALECSAEFRALNFEDTFREVAGPNGAMRKEVEYRITRDGFAFLCMGFTGAKAALWKEKYIDTFNCMADKLVQRQPAPTPAKAIKPAPQPLRIEHDTKGITPAMAGAINARAFEIVSSALPGVHKWLTDQVLRGCITPMGTAAPNFANTLAAADFAAYSTNYASRHLAHAESLLRFAHKETALALANVQVERARLATQGHSA